MSFWFEFFKDKRFGWKFKIANFIMNDYLRNYLASAYSNANAIIENDNIHVVQFRAKKVSKTLKDVMEM